MSSTILECISIKKKYPKADHYCVNGVSIAVRRGEKFGIFGPNGAGKTTLISMLCDLLSPTEGEVRYFKDEKQVKASQMLPLIGYVPQDFAFYPELSATENLKFFGGVYGIPKDKLDERITHLLDRVGLTGVQHQRITTFSGGMKRRVNLAIGLINDPEILFLDEPTVGVDVQSRHAILKLLNELNAKGTTIVYTSHLLKEAEDFCDRIALIDQGVLLALGEMQELLTVNNLLSLEEMFIALTGNKLRD